MKFTQIDTDDEALIEAARDIIRKIMILPGMWLEQPFGQPQGKSTAA